MGNLETHIRNNVNNLRYLILKDTTYYSKRYNKNISVKAGFPSDGATCAVDIKGSIPAYDTWEKELTQVSLSWVIHDKLCNTGRFDDGTRCTNWQASVILSDVLRSEASWRYPFRIIRAYTWLPATFLFGGQEARKNGMFKLKGEG